MKLISWNPKQIFTCVIWKSNIKVASEILNLGIKHIHANRIWEYFVTFLTFKPIYILRNFFFAHRTSGVKYILCSALNLLEISAYQKNMFLISIYFTHHFIVHFSCQLYSNSLNYNSNNLHLNALFFKTNSIDFLWL